MSDTPTTSTSEDPDRIPRSTTVAIGLLVVSAFVLILNETIMGVALRPIATDLGVSTTTGQWLTTAFLLTMAIVIPITGFALQRLSTRTVFLTAMISFALGTLVCATAPGFEVLVVGRVVQAVGTAIIMPLLMTTAMQLVPPMRRGRVMGTVSIVISVAPATGPVVSGAILNAFDSWRFLFWVVLPLVLLMLGIGALRIPNVSEPKPVPLDVLSVVLSALGFGGLVYGLSSFGEGGGDHEAAVSPFVPIGVGVVALVVFVLRQRALARSDRALLDLRTFAAPTFRTAISIMVVMMGALFGSIILLPLYLQDVLGLDTLHTGLLLVPGGLLMGAMGPVVGRLFDRVGPRPLILPGGGVVALAMLGMSQFATGTSVWYVVACHMVLSLGLSLIFTPLFTSALGSVEPHLYSHGSAIIGTVQQLAGAVGIAVLVAVATLRTVAGTEAGLDEPTAFAAGVSTSFLVGAVLAALAIPLALMIRRPTTSVPGGAAH